MTQAYFPIETFREVYIFGEPIDTPYGKAHFLSYKDYVLNAMKVAIISQNSLHFYHMYYKILKDNKDAEVQQLLETIREQPLLHTIHSHNDYLRAYYDIFSLVFKESSATVIEELLSDEFAFLDARRIVMDMNLMKEQEVSPNPEVQYFLEKGREVKNVGEKITSTDYLTSISVGSGISLEQAASYSIYMVYSVMARIGQMKSYESSVLYSTVADKVKVESWSKHIDLFENEKSGMSKDNFKKTFGSILS